jgi:hypothetical protein
VKCVDESSALVIGVGEMQKDFYGKFGHDRRAYFKSRNVNLFSHVFPVQCHPFII